MATKSIYHTVSIKDKHLCKRFISALEHAQEKKSKEVVISKKVTEASIDQIRSMFAK